MKVSALKNLSQLLYFRRVKNYWDVDQLADRRPLTPKVPRSIRGIPAKQLESSVTVSTTAFDSVNGRFDSSFSSQTISG